MAKNNYSHITSSQLATICKVSQGTVDRALNNREGINPKTKEKILSAAKKYGYSPNLPRGNISGTRSMLYGVVLLDLNNDYFSRFVMDFEKLCKDIGYNSVVMFSHNDLNCEIGCINQLMHLGVDGIVICPVGKNLEYSSFLRSIKTPVVTIGNKIDGIPFVGIDDLTAMKDVTEYAISKGYKNFIYYAPVLKNHENENIFAQERRYLGFTQAIDENGLTRILVTNKDKLTSIISQQKPCAVICPTDAYAIRVFNIIRENNFSGVGLCGFDDCDILQKANINIDSVAYGREVLISQIYSHFNGDPEQAFVPHKLVCRGSL